MRREIYIASLTVGRCFTVKKLPEDNAGSASDGEKIQHGRTIMSPDMVWKVTGQSADGEFTAESADGESASFSSKTLVVEIPRQGFDRLVERARQGG